MAWIVAVHAAAAVLLAIGGAAKIARPTTASDLFESLGLPRTKLVTLLTRGLGVFEVAVGTVALAVGGTLPAAAVACLYAVFAVATLRAVVAGVADCGCFGMRGVPPSWLHVIVDLVLAAASLAAVGQSTPVEVMEGQPAGGAGFMLAVGVMAGLLLAMFTVAPKALAFRRSAASR